VTTVIVNGRLCFSVYIRWSVLRFDSLVCTTFWM